MRLELWVVAGALYLVSLVFCYGLLRAASLTGKESEEEEVRVLW